MSTTSDRQDHLSPFRGTVSVTLAYIDQQRRDGWPDIHPEDFCHRCAGRNISWHIASDVWNAVMRPEGADSPWRWSEIICPACFAELFEARWPGTSFDLSLHELTRGPKNFRAEQSQNALVVDERTE
jgi:hypothetical protein